MNLGNTGSSGIIIIATLGLVILDMLKIVQVHTRRRKSKHSWGPPYSPLATFMLLQCCTKSSMLHLLLAIYGLLWRAICRTPRGTQRTHVRSLRTAYATQWAWSNLDTYVEALVQQRHSISWLWLEHTMIPSPYVIPRDYVVVTTSKCVEASVFASFL